MRQFEAQLRTAALSGEVSWPEQIRIIQTWYAKQSNLENSSQVIDGISAGMVRQFCAEKSSPRRIHVARMAVMNAISDQVTNVFPLTVREADDYFYSTSILSNGDLRPIDIIAGLDRSVIDARTGALLTQLANTTEQYIGDALMWLTAVQDAASSKPIAAGV